MDNETIVIQTNEERIELTGKELEDFLTQRAKDQAELNEQQAKMDAAKAAKDSATAKLTALGLTEDEVLAITGQTKPIVKSDAN